MSDVKWIKLSANLFENGKIRLIKAMPGGDTAIVLWIKLLCLAGTQFNTGVFQMENGCAYTDKMFAVVLQEEEATVRAAFDLFEQYGMIETIDGVVMIPDWGEHQSLDQMDKTKAYQREYHKEYRKKQKMLEGQSSENTAEVDAKVDTEANSEACSGSDAEVDTDADVQTVADAEVYDKIDDKVDGKVYGKVYGKVDGKVYGKVDVNAPDKKREDKKREDKKKEGKEKEAPRFYPPKLEEVADYCLQRGNGIDPQQFMDHYEAVGWMVGKTKMKDWRASVRTWERNDIARKKQPEPEYQLGADHSWGGFDD